MNIFINDDKKLDGIIKTLNLKISKEQHDMLVCELYKHIDHTRKKSFGNGYEQGRFDEKMDRY